MARQLFMETLRFMAFAPFGIWPYYMLPTAPRPLSFWTKCGFYSPRTRRYRVPQAGCTPLTANSYSTVTNRTPRGCNRSTISRAAVTLVG